MNPGVIVHPHGLCESETVGAGTRVWAFAHVLVGAVVGEDCNICDGAFIEGGATVGNRVTIKNHCLIWDKVTIADDVFVGPNVVFTNDPRPRIECRTPTDQWETTTVQQGATIAANATIVCGVTVGHHAFVGAGSVVTRDVPAHRLVFGNPARPRGWVCRCANPLDAELACPACGACYELVSEDDGLRARAPSP